MGSVLSEKYGIESIDFNGVIEIIFWDTDFLKDNISELSMEAGKQLRASPEIFGLSMAMKPHPEELAFKLCEPANDTKTVKLYIPGPKEYPDFGGVSS